MPEAVTQTSLPEAIHEGKAHTWKQIDRLVKIVLLLVSSFAELMSFGLNFI